MRRLWKLWRQIRWGWSGDRSGLTVPCWGACPEPDGPYPHSAHLAPGALRYLARGR